MKKFAIAFAVVALLAAPAFAKGPSVNAGVVGGVSSSGASSGVSGGSMLGGTSFSTVTTQGTNVGSVATKGANISQVNQSTTVSTGSSSTHGLGAATFTGGSAANGINGGITFGAGLKF